METYIEKLDELIAAKKVKGHKISKKEVEEYSVTWTMLVKSEGGFSPRAEKYFHDGFIFLGAKPFVQWVLESENVFASLEALLKGSLFGKDTSSTFRILVNVLANLLLVDLPDNNLICPVIKAIPLQSKNKENKTLKDAHRIFLKYYVDEMDLSVNYPVFSDLNLRPEFKREFANLMDELFERLKTVDLPNKHMIVLDKTVRWIHPKSNASEKADNRDATPKADICTPEKSPGIVEKNKNEPLVKEQPKDAYEKLIDLLKQAYTMTNQLRAMSISADKKTSDAIAALRHDNDLIRSKNDEIEKHNTSLETQLTESNTQIGFKTDQIRDLEQVVDKLEADIVAKETEIDQRTQMMEALSRDRSRQADEQINRLASRLKVEYRDFKDAEGLEMDVDLGENMREQLKNIFAIIIKAGIKID